MTTVEAFPIPLSAVSGPEAFATAGDGGLQRSRIELWLLRAALRAVIATSSLFWFMVLPLWWADCLRTIAIISWQNVVSVYIKARPVDLKRLERVVTYWPRGLMAILSVKDGQRIQVEFAPKDVKTLLVETGVAIFFYAALFLTSLVLYEVVQPLLLPGSTRSIPSESPVQIWECAVQ